MASSRPGVPDAHRDAVVMGKVVVLKVKGTEPKGDTPRAALIRYTEENFEIGITKSAAFADHLLTFLFIEGFIVVKAPEDEG